MIEHAVQATGKLALKLAELIKLIKQKENNMKAKNENFMKTTEEKANKYANRNFVIQVGEIPSIKVDISEHLKRAYIAGTKDAFTSQWRSEEDELPKDQRDVFVRFVNYAGGVEYGCAYYDGEDWFTTNGEHIRPTHWLPIPELPKQEK